MKMSEVFEKCELNFEGYFELAVEMDTNGQLAAARHAVNCHDELVEALESIQDFFKVNSFSMHDLVDTHVRGEVDEALAKAKRIRQ